jgi:hypothetical protein
MTDHDPSEEEPRAASDEAEDTSDEVEGHSIEEEDEGEAGMLDLNVACA